MLPPLQSMALGHPAHRLVCKAKFVLHVIPPPPACSPGGKACSEQGIVEPGEDHLCGSTSAMGDLFPCVLERPHQVLRIKNRNHITRRTNHVT